MRGPSTPPRQLDRLLSKESRLDEPEAIPVSSMQNSSQWRESCSSFMCESTARATARAVARARAWP
eukprot:6182397-Pleurochrysis_carterae.AAC.1